MTPWCVSELMGCLEIRTDCVNFKDEKNAVGRLKRQFTHDDGCVEPAQSIILSGDAQRFYQTLLTADFLLLNQSQRGSWSETSGVIGSCTRNSMCEG